MRIGLSITCLLTAAAFAATDKSTPPKRVQLHRVPGGGIQPQVVVDRAGTLHLIYYTGDARGGDLQYVRSTDGGATFSQPVRVNSQPGSAVAAGTIRGGQIALGSSGRLHVAWNGSMEAKPEGPMNPDSGKPGMPMLYARMNDAHSGFEPQRNLMTRSYGLDGGGTVAADAGGNVYVAWHGLANGDAGKGEAGRQVWVARSTDDGKTFPPEQKAWSRETGACGCCGMKMFTDAKGNLHALYRSATEAVHRDVWLLTSTDKGRTFDGRLLHKWEINACPMSSMDFAANSSTVVAAWETGGQVFWAPLKVGRDPIAATGAGKNRKHPRVAINPAGDVLLVWTEGTGWQRGGSLAWQVYDRNGEPTSDKGQIASGIPAWSFGAAALLPDGSFSVVY